MKQKYYPTDELIIEIANLYVDTFLSGTKIAKIYNIPIKELRCIHHYKLFKDTIKKRTNNLSIIEYRKKKKKLIINQLWQEGKSVKEIAKLTNFSKPSIRLFINEKKKSKQVDKNNLCKHCKKNDKGNNRWYCDECLSQLSSYYNESFYNSSFNISY